MGLTIEEQETHINFSRNDEWIEIYTSDTLMITKLFKLQKSADTEWKIKHVHKLQNGEIIGYTFSCPAKCLSFRKKAVTRNYTEEQRREFGERMKGIRQKQTGK